jgi:uncharacterized protein (DUF2147 family)
MRLVFGAFVILVFQVFAVAAHAQSGLEGLWHTQGNRSIVRVAPCGEAYCGTIVSVAPKPDGSVWRDTHNPNPALQHRTMEGVQILSGLRVRGAGWSGGKIYNPADGRTYDARARLLANGSLQIDGCVAVFCRAQIWAQAQAQ